MPTFDGEALIITLDSGVTNVNVQEDLYETWKVWMLAGNMRFPPAFRTIGGDPLSAIINAGAYFFLQNDSGWRIKPPEEDITIYLVGNLAAEDTELPSIVATDGAYTAAILGLQPVTQGVTPEMKDQLRYNAFQQQITIDIVNGISGTLFPAGTVEYPSDNLEDAYTIAVREGFKVFYINTSMTLSGSLDFSAGYKFKGHSPVTVQVVVDTSLDVLNCEFWDMQISGTLDGGNVFRECIVGAVDYVNGFLYNSALVGPITLGGGQAASIAKCWGFTGAAVQIDMGGAGNQMAVSEWSGTMEVVNCTGGLGITEIASLGGEVSFDNTISGGYFEIHGAASVIDDSIAGATVIDRTTTKRVDDTWKVKGLDVANPASISESGGTTTVTADDVTIDITDTSITRQ